MSHTERARLGTTRRQWLGSAGAALSACGVLAACGPRRRSDDAGSVPPAPRALSGTVTFWHGWGTRAQLLRGYLDQFERENPGVKVEDTEAAGMGGRDKFPIAIIAGTVPDTLHAFVEFLPELVRANALLPLGPYVARDKLDLKAFYDTEVRARTFNDQLLVLPGVVAANATFVWWNKELFRRAGLNPEQGPKTWAQAQEMAVQLTTRQGSEVQQLGFDPGAPPGTTVFTNQFIRWLYHNDGKFLTDDGKKVAFHDDAGVATLEWLAQLMARQGPFEATRRLAGRDAFFRRELAMIAYEDNFGSLIRASDQARDIPLGVALLPVHERNPRARVATPAIGGHGYAVPKEAKNPEAGWALARFLTVTDAACSFLTRDQGRFSPLRRCADIPEARALPEFAVFVAGAQAGVEVPITGANAAIATIISTAVLSVYEGKQAPKAALDEAAREAQAVLDRWHRGG